MTIAKLLLLLLLLHPVFGNAEKTKNPKDSIQNKSLLRVNCDGESSGADISLNGNFKGQCPVDITLTEGEYKLLAKKNIGESYVGRFDKSIRIGDGVIQKVEVILDKQLTEVGRALADENKKQLAVVYEIEKKKYERAMIEHNSKVQKCAEDKAYAINDKGADCFMNSGGCVGGFICETYEERYTRCYGNPKGRVFSEQFESFCAQGLESKKPKEPSPISLSTE